VMLAIRVRKPEGSSNPTLVTVKGLTRQSTVKHPGKERRKKMSSGGSDWWVAGRMVAIEGTTRTTVGSKDFIKRKGVQTQACTGPFLGVPRGSDLARPEERSEASAKHPWKKGGGRDP